jgi:hypothetical protein
MGFSFTNEDIEQISTILSKSPKEFEKSWSWRFDNPETKQSLVITIYNNVKLGKESEGSLISVQSQHGYFELHDCRGYLVFEPDEIIFVQSTDDKVSSLIVGKQATCSMFTNISRDILNADFTTLDPTVLLSAMQLSLTETIL